MMAKICFFSEKCKLTTIKVTKQDVHIMFLYNLFGSTPKLLYLYNRFFLFEYFRIQITNH